MQAPIDPELVTAGVYLLIGPLYGLLWHHHIRHAYAALAIAALILSVCALLRSETVRAWDPQPLHHPHTAPVNAPLRESDFPTLAQAWIGRSDFREATSVPFRWD
jgi:hypothetical protein